MSRTIPVIAGIADPIDIQFTNRDFDSLADPAPFDASGKTVTLEVRGIDGSLVDTTGKVAWTDETLSKARFTRLSGDIVAGKTPYRARWFVTDGSGVHPYPSTVNPDIWQAYNPT